MDALIEFCTWGLMILSAVLIGAMLLAVAAFIVGTIVGFFWLAGVVVRDLWREFGPGKEAPDEA